jgi:hypothetical protein
MKKSEIEDWVIVSTMIAVVFVLVELALQIWKHW